MTTIFTIGHSNMEIDAFIALLQSHQIEAIVDVRSTPASSWATHFNREPLRRSLRTVDIRYAFMGAQLGARSSDPGHYREGQVVYDRVAESEGFRDAIAQVVRNASQLRIALMCAEQDPLSCHRSVLISRVLVERGSGVMHILSDGSTCTQPELESRLLIATKQDQPDLFLSAAERVAEAWAQREHEIAYRLPDSTSHEQRLVIH